MMDAILNPPEPNAALSQGGGRASAACRRNPGDAGGRHRAAAANRTTDAPSIVGFLALDRYFREQASQDVKRHVGNCFVATERDVGGVAAYYALAGFERSRQLPSGRGDQETAALSRPASRRSSAGWPSTFRYQGRQIGSALIRRCPPSQCSRRTRVIHAVGRRQGRWRRRLLPQALGFIPLESSPPLPVFADRNGIEAGSGGTEGSKRPVETIGSAPVSFSVSSTIDVFTCCTESCGSSTSLTKSRQRFQVRRHDLQDVVHLAGQARAPPAPPAGRDISSAKRRALSRLWVASVTEMTLTSEKPSLSRSSIAR